jgi:sulfur-oxidizing protein SoxX
MTHKKTLMSAALLAFILPMSALHAADVVTVAREVIDRSFPAGDGQDLERLKQDETLLACTASRDKPDATTAKSITEREKENIKYPDSGALMGDWQKGEKLVNAGFAMRIGVIEPDAKEKQRGGQGGNCYACHAIDKKEVAAGNIGPSLTDYGKRGTSEAMVKYTYEKIYNPQAYMACSNMPRLGHNGVLSPEQIADVTAYLLSPESTLNK